MVCGLTFAQAGFSEQGKSPSSAKGSRLKLTLSSGVARAIGKSSDPDGFIATRYVDEGRLPDLSREEQQRGYVLFARHWMDLVFPNSIPARSEVTDHLAAFASPGECEPFTFCVRSVKEISGLDITVGEFVSKNGATISAPEVQVVRCVPRLWLGEEPVREEGPVGVMNMPTYLEEPRLIDMVAERTVQFWLTTEVPSDAKPGTYEAQVQVSHDQSDPYPVMLTLEILPVALVKPDLRLGFWDFQRPYQGEIGSLDEVYQTMNRHGINAVFTHAGIYQYDKKTDTYDFSQCISVSDEGRVTVDLAGCPLAERAEAARRTGILSMIYNTHIWMFVAEEVQNRYEREVLEKQSLREVRRVLRRYRNSPHYDLIKEEIKGTSEKMFPLYSDAFGSLYVEVLRSILGEAEKHRWPLLLLDPGDEIRSAHVRDKTAFPRVIRFLELMKRAGATTIMNHLSPTMGDEYADYGSQVMRYLDVGMPGLRVGSRSPYGATIEKTARDFTSLGIAAHTYSNSGQAGVTPDLSIVRFNAGFFFGTLGRQVVGEFDYIFYRPEEDPYNPTDGRHLWSHERMWFFPPQAESSRLGGRALVLAAKRQGYDDLRYLKTLDKLLEQAESAGDSPQVKEAARAAQGMLDRMLGSFTFTDRTLDTNRRQFRSEWDVVSAAPGAIPVVKGKSVLHNGWQYEDYDRNRRKLADAAIKLQQVLASGNSNIGK